MEKRRKQKLKPNLLLIGTIIINIVLVICVVFLMRHVQNLLNSDVEINLTEIVTQNKDAITSRLMLEVNNLKTLSEKMSGALESKETLDKNFPAELMARYGNQYDDELLAVADSNGQATFENGEVIDIEGRNYFKLAMEGSQNISDKIVSRLTGEDAFIISVPLYRNGIIIGTLQKSYSHDQMYALCDISIFSSQGYVYIIDSQGYILLHTEHENCYRRSDNYFRDLYEAGNQQSSQQVEADLKSGKSGFSEVVMNGHKIFSAYMPIEKLHDWYLITSVPMETVSPNGTRVIQIFYYILLFVVLISFSSILYFLNYKNRQRLALEKIAYVDSVTDGNTYNKFLQDVGSLLAENPDKQFTMLKFDIDNFRYINNYYGFDYGDKILRDIIRRVSSKLSELETVARISGDHFVILLENADNARLEELLNFGKNEDNINIYCSAGLYPIMDATENINLMVDKAGIAEHSVKGVLTTQIGHYSEKFDLQAMQNEELKRAVVQALSDQEFEPFYQPKVDIGSGVLVGAEALVRWRTADGTLVPPGLFIPMCEQTGLVVEIDFMMLERVLCFLKRNLDAKEKCVPIAVNFSRLHLLDEQFSKRIQSMVEKYNVPAGLVELELTESAIFDNMETIGRFAKALRSYGFSIAMDDFGSGYSSLNMLKDIPIDTLKIDRGFLLETTNNERRNIIFSAVTQMASRLDIDVVVEGVEYLENVELMRTCGCHIAQGYYFAKPMEESAFQRVLEKGAVEHTS